MQSNKCCKSSLMAKQKDNVLSIKGQICNRSFGALNEDETWNWCQNKLTWCPWISISISPSWCCLCQDSYESVNYIFTQCRFIKSLWSDITIAFGWSTVLSPKDTMDWINLFLLNHPFRGQKAELWNNLICPIISKIWEERNDCIFNNRAKSDKEIYDSSIFIALFCGKITT